VSQKTAYSEGNLYLCLGYVIRVLDPLFFISSHGVGLLFTKSISDIVFAIKRFALKIKLKN